MYSPKYEVFKEDVTNRVHLGKLTSVYPETKGVSSKWLRSKVATVRKNISKLIKDPLEKSLLKEKNLVSLSEAIEYIHFPEDISNLEEARKRLAFDELLSVAFRIESNLKEREKQTAFNQIVFEKEIKSFEHSLQFNLTKDQKKGIEEILEDLTKTYPMNRLLNGDVGSGKTIVAAVAIYNTLLNKKSAILMAPTTVLAQQHYNTFKNLFKDLKIPTELCVADNKKSSKAKNRLIIGTHAILYKKYLPETGLVIIDEQHRFGVNQRKKLEELEEKSSPHILTMTATPIPRSLTKSIYGEIDISIINELPKNRIPIKTYFTPFTKRAECFEWVAEKIRKGDNQAFLVYPLIEESEAISAKAVTKEFDELNKGIFKNLKVAFLHGRMKEDEKQRILESFRKKEYNVLVSTSVIEVGLDIPDASIMVVENAERFGLAQLHQLRGRVGRGEKQSYCFVIPGQEISEDATDRLKYFSKHNSGFDVAEYDLERRGPGEVYGNRQSGIPQFKVAKLTDFDLLKTARIVAKEFLNRDNCDVEKIKKGLFK